MGSLILRPGSNLIGLRPSVNLHPSVPCCTTVRNPLWVGWWIRDVDGTLVLAESRALVESRKPELKDYTRVLCTVGVMLANGVRAMFGDFSK